MIVRETKDAWQVVLQTDHALLCGQFAAAWGNDAFTAPAPLTSLRTAAARHDDGWAIWERAPTLLMTDGGCRPRNFLDVPIGVHLAFYRAQIATVSEEDRYAGLLISMHGAGIYNGRYGTDPHLRLTHAPEERRAVDAFVHEQEDQRRRIVSERAIDEPELWTNYRLLQIYDRLSLYFCMRDLQRGEPAALGPVPVGYDGGETELRIEPVGPWRVRMTPYPFGDEPAVFDLALRRLPKRGWPDNDAFREEFAATPVEQIQVQITGGS